MCTYLLFISYVHIIHTYLSYIYLNFSFLKTHSSQALFDVTAFRIPTTATFYKIMYKYKSLLKVFFLIRPYLMLLPSQKKNNCLVEQHANIKFIIGVSNSHSCSDKCCKFHGSNKQGNIIFNSVDCYSVAA